MPPPGINNGVFTYGSSPVDWCEPNYAYSGYIAEFFNTVSSIPICITGLLHIINYKTFYRKWDSRVRVLGFLALAVGLGSVWFHLTLSIAGQLADELLILWMSSFGQACYFPIAVLPRDSVLTRVHLQMLFVGVALVSTLFSHVYPYMNHFALVAVSIPQYFGVTMAVFNRAQAPPPLLLKLFYSVTCTWAVALTFWIIDQALCATTLSWNFPHFHALWHVISSLGICQSLNLSLFLDLEASNRLEDISVELRRFPRFLGYFSYQYLLIR